MDLLSQIRHPERQIDVGEFLRALVDKMGGVAVLAEHMADIIKDDKAPATLKGKCLSITASLIQHYTDHDLGQEVDVEDLSDEDLQAVLKECLGRGPTGKALRDQYRPAWQEKHNADRRKRGRARNGDGITPDDDRVTSGGDRVISDGESQEGTPPTVA